MKKRLLVGKHTRKIELEPQSGWIRKATRSASIGSKYSPASWCSCFSTLTASSTHCWGSATQAQLRGTLQLHLPVSTAQYLTHLHSHPYRTSSILANSTYQPSAASRAPANPPVLAQQTVSSSPAQPSTSITSYTPCLSPPPRQQRAFPAPART